jgi:N-acetylneuraminic acid mutarotase
LVASLYIILCTACLFTASSVAIGESPSKPTLATWVSVELSMKSRSPPIASPPTGLWTLLGSQPPGRDGHGFVYDSKADRFIVFGGAVSGTEFTNSTWSYDYTNNSWMNITPTVGPSPRAGAGIAYDSDVDRVVLFGGSLAGNDFAGDTWSFDYSNDTWSDRSPSSAPAPRSISSMVYDNLANRTILFGGGGASGPFDDTWTYHYGTNSWELLNANSPGALFGSSMTYDTAVDRVLLFGGAILGVTPVWMNDTWVLSVAAKTWTNAYATTSPAARAGASLAYDSISDVTLLFGGSNTFANNPSGYFNDTWAYNATANVWSDVTPVHSPTPRVLSGLAYDPVAERTVLFGGDESGVPYADAWAFQYVPQAPSFPPSAPRNLAATAGQGEVILNWVAPVSDSGSSISGYKIYRARSAGLETLLKTVGPVLGYTDSGLTNGLTYYYQVSALNSVGEGPKSNEASATPNPAPDRTPPAITITSPVNNADVSSTILTVSGTASDDVAVARVEVSADGATWTTASGTTAWTADVTLHIGSNTLYARATDTSENQATMRITVVVTSPTLGSLGLLPPLIVGFGIAVVLVAVLAVLLMNRRHRRSGGSPKG